MLPNVPSRARYLTCDILKLPNELLLEIAKHLPGRRDLNSFVKTCNTTWAIVNPYMFRQSALQDNYALLWATEQGMQSTVQLAIRYGADVNATIQTGSPILTKTPHCSPLKED